MTTKKLDPKKIEDDLNKAELKASLNKKAGDEFVGPLKDAIEEFEKEYDCEFLTDFVSDKYTEEERNKLFELKISNKLPDMEIAWVKGKLVMRKKEDRHKYVTRGDKLLDKFKLAKKGSYTEKNGIGTIEVKKDENGNVIDQKFVPESSLTA